MATESGQAVPEQCLLRDLARPSTYLGQVQPLAALARHASSECSIALITPNPHPHETCQHLLKPRTGHDRTGPLHGGTRVSQEKMESKTILFFEAPSVAPVRFQGGNSPAAQWIPNFLLQEACGYSFVASAALRLPHTCSNHRCADTQRAPLVVECLTCWNGGGRRLIPCRHVN